jgi:DNA-binding transcriptional LysR family regulator
MIAERVASNDLMMALVAAGFALGLVRSSQIAASLEADVVARPLAGDTPMITTYLLSRPSDSSETLTRFINRIGLGEVTGSEPAQAGP